MLHELAQFLKKESFKPGIAPTNAFALVEWCSLLLQVLTDDLKYNVDVVLDVIAADARALEICLGSASKEGLRHSAIIVTRRGLRAVLSSKKNGEDVLRRSVTCLTSDSTSGPKNGPLLGVIAGVCARMSEKKPVLESMKDNVFNFYTKEIVGSRTVLPAHITGGLDDFFSSFVSVEDLRKSIWPPLEKAILRAPEVIFSGVLLTLVYSIPKRIDLSQDLHDHFIKPLLSSIKSSNAVVKDGAVCAAKEILTHCSAEGTLSSVADEVVGPLKAQKVTNFEQRALQCQIISAIPCFPNLSQKLLLDLTPVFDRETSDAALEPEVDAFVRHLTYLLQTQTPLGQNFFTAPLKGCQEKKINFRRVWLSSLGNMIWNVDNELLFSSNVSSDIMGVVLARFQESFNEICSNPLPSIQNGSITLAYILLALTTHKLKGVSNEEVIQQALSVSPKPSFLLSPRVYSKLTSRDDIIWNIRALSSVARSEGFQLLSFEAMIAWAQAFLFLLCSSTFPPRLREQAVASLHKCYLSYPHSIGKCIIQTIWNWISALNVGDKESAALAAGSKDEKLLLAIKAITPAPSEAISIDRQVLSSQLIDLLVLCRPELVPRSRWIDIVLQTGLDPGVLVRENQQACLHQIVSVIDVSKLLSFQTNLSFLISSFQIPILNKVPNLMSAACNAAADLAFVNPAVVIPLLVEQFCNDLKVERILNLGPLDVAISRTPEGTTFVDVLDSKTKPVTDKKTKDYDTLKWEEELRAQMAQKHGHQKKKLTLDEKAKVDNQLAKEADIRRNVLSQEVMIRRGAGIIESLAKALNDPQEWMNPAVRCLTELSKADVGVLVGSSVASAYVACANKISLRLGNIRPFIGIATLRALGKTYLPPELEEEPLGALITRILYRLRLSSEKLPFDSVSLGYFLPLVFITLDFDGIEESPDNVGEQVMLCLEILSAHTGTFSDSRLPRAQVLRQLISAMQRYNQHYKVIRETLTDFCRCIAPNIEADELNILLQATIVPEIPVRTAVLQAVLNELDLTDLEFSEYIWLSCHDHVTENAEISEAIWEQNALDVDEDSPSVMIKYLSSHDSQLRGESARALAHACELVPTKFADIVKELRSRYIEEIKEKVPEKDAYGMPRRVDTTDLWEVRSGIALAVRYMAQQFQGDLVVEIIQFLIDNGPLVDKNSRVRQQMTEAGTAVIACRGQERVEKLMDVLELTLETSDKGSKQSDWLNESVIVLYGSLARHLEPGDKRVSIIIQKLLDALPTPSENVQYAVAECLPPVIRLSSDSIDRYVQELLSQLFQSKSYAARRGAAYGLAGIVRGKGISVIREYRIMAKLQDASENKRDPNQRQGAVLAFELFSLVLGRTFEPYVIQIVPQLLSSFGDPVIEVRNACLDASKTCFANLSSYGVKQILPTLLEGLDETQWRSKKGACDLLGAMAYLDPQQLSTSLPEIIPPLTEVLNDTHKEVRKSADRSLQRFGDVISNPEVKSLVGSLLKALSDPIKYTDDALNSLIKVSFVHYLDAPSLALVVRVLERGLGDRSATKRKSAQIIGSLAHLTERKDLTSHLPILVAGLKVAIVDPVPTTRATASKALGSLIEKLGEDSLPDLIPSLMSTLKSDTGAGDRLGSAQALSEVLAGLGTSRLEETLPTMLQNASSSKPSVREGFMSLFVFLPACFGNSFASYLNRIIPPILSGLADEVESIRETALRAGRLLVKNFASKSIDLLLPELERGLADDSYRIRLSSVELVGDLLFSLGGIQNKEVEEEETAARAGQSLLEALGEERRNKVLSSLYICRCDTSALVRTAAINVWKALVASPRTLRDLVPTLSQLIIKRLGSTNMEHKVIASASLGELIKKAGEGVLSTLLPSMEEGLMTASDVDSKQGICIALGELVKSASPDALEAYEKSLTSIVRTALVDSDKDVREAAADAFDTLQQIFGKRIVDQVLPDLLSLLRNPADARRSLAALLTLLTEATRASVILPNLIPTLLTNPITAFNANALASLVQVAGASINRRLPTILNVFMDNIISTRDDELKEELTGAFDTVLSSANNVEGLHTTMTVMVAMIKHEDHKRRAASARRLAKFFGKMDVDLSRYYPDLIDVLLISFDDYDTDVVRAAWEALTQLTSHMRKEQMESLVVPTRQTLRHVGVPGANLSGFCLPKGIGSIFPIFLQGLLYGSVDQKVQAALGISDIIDRTSPEALKPYVTQITGPLIRVVSERSADVKCKLRDLFYPLFLTHIGAIFLALNKLLEKIPLFVKPFLPQLQRTFARGLSDTTSDMLRKRAANGLGILITLTPRVDPLIAELVAGSKTANSGVKGAMLQALHEVVNKAGGSMSEASRQSILNLIEEGTSGNNGTNTRGCPMLSY